MSFAAEITELQADCFTELGEAAVYTPGGGGTAVPIRAILDEPNEPPFSRDLPRSPFRERITSVWLPRVDAVGAPFSPAKDATVVMTTSHGVVRTVVLVSLQQEDPDRAQWKVREGGP